jgi:type IV pilus assembly protein PilX
MRSHRTLAACAYTQQRGVSLVTTLLFMVAALMLGVSVLSVNVMQERTIGNTKDRDLALHAAEAALRDAEKDILANQWQSMHFSAACTNGLCKRPSDSSVPIEVGLDWTDNDKVRKAAKFPGLPDTEEARPRYIIEHIGEVPAPQLGPDSGGSVKQGTSYAAGSSGAGYRVTAYAQGARQETTVVLQSVFTVQGN